MVSGVYHGLPHPRPGNILTFCCLCPVCVMFNDVSVLNYIVVFYDYIATAY